MRKTCQEIFLKHIKEIQLLPQNKSCNGIVLILDDHTTQLLSPLIQTDSLFDYGIRTLSKSSLVKKPQPNLLSIYFIKSESLKDLIRDFQKEPIYFSINLLLNEPISKQVMQKIGKEQKIIQRLAFFAELHINCTYYSQKIAILGQPNVLNSCWEANLKEGRILGQELFTGLICGFGNFITLDIFYYSSSFCQQIVKELEKCMKEHLNSIQEENEEQQFTQIKIVIADRKYDTISPVIQSFYYYPMLYDILKVDSLLKPKIIYENTEISPDLQGKIWKRYKNMHINQALGAIQENFNTFKDQNSVAKFNQTQSLGKVSDAKQIKGVIRSLPQYNSIVKSYNDHMSLMEQILKRTKNSNLTQIGDLEHTIASNLTSKGQFQKDKKILSKSMKILESIKNQQLKKRLLLITILGLELTESEKQSLLKQLCVLVKSESFVQVIKLAGKLPCKLNFQNKQKKNTLFLDRHQCKLKICFQNFLQGKTDKQFRNMKIGQKVKPDSPTKYKKIGENQHFRKWVAYIAGGIGHNEISSIQNLFNKFQGNQFNLITDTIYNPESYIKSLSQMFKK